MNRAVAIRGVVVDARCEAASVAPHGIAVLTGESEPPEELPIKVQGEVEIVSVLR